MITIHKVHVSIGKTPILTDISFRMKKGEFFYITGPSGVGKTTLLRTIYLDLLPNSGWVRIGKLNTASVKRNRIPYIRRKLGIVFQDYKLLDDRPVIDNVAFAARVTGHSAKSARKKALKALTAVGLLSKKDAALDALSGGEMQRTCIARAIVNDPHIIIADEPSGNLDPDTTRDIFSLLKTINENGASVLVATHNHSVIDKFPGTIVRLAGGTVVPTSENTA